MSRQLAFDFNPPRDLLATERALVRLAWPVYVAAQNELHGDDSASWEPFLVWFGRQG